MSNQQYVVSANERWDNIAYKAYGDAGKIEVIVAANPDVPVTPVIKAGTVLNIPILPEEEITTPSELLPPWMR